MFLGPHTVEVINPGTKPTDYGTGTEPDWTTATTVTVEGCSVQPVAGVAFTVDRHNVTTRWVAWLPLGTPITGRSRVVWNGDTYDVDGDPLVWEFDPVGHIVINLKRSTG